MSDMLFTSSNFIFLFLPLALGSTAIACNWFGRPTAIYVMIAASLIFYGSWHLWALVVISTSIVCNNTIANKIEQRNHHKLPTGLLFAGGIAANLITLGFFKYTNFAVATVADLTGTSYDALAIVLPLGISFYTFQQIMFLADVRTGRIGSVKPHEYIVAVLFFPHLIAGPLVNYRDIIGQFRDKLGVSVPCLILGVGVFVVGLAKKLVIADPIGAIVSPLYMRAELHPLDLNASWMAALGYSAQLYFDFSGYSDMAIGLGLMFGISLPMNFLSPYKAPSIIEFWRRWHITLARFLRDYLYIPLGGSRISSLRQYVNIMIVMVLGGLWHGAGWTFVAWGALHGGYVVVNHIWRKTLGRLLPSSHWLSASYALITFLSVVIGWVLFRSSNTVVAANVLSGMIGRQGVVLPGMIAYIFTLDIVPSWLSFSGEMSFPDFIAGWTLIVVALAICWFTPNTAQLFGLSIEPGGTAVVGHASRTQVALRVALVTVLVWLSALAAGSAPSSAFIYFQF